MSRSKFQPNFVLLCEELDLDSILPYLHQERMVTRDEYETATNPAYTQKQRRSMLLGYLPRKGSRYYENFCKCLVWSGQVDLARHIGVDVESIPPSPHQRLAPVAPGRIPEQNSQELLHQIKRLISLNAEPATRTTPLSYPHQETRRVNSLPSYAPSSSSSSSSSLGPLHNQHHHAHPSLDPYVTISSHEHHAGVGVGGAGLGGVGGVGVGGVGVGGASYMPSGPAPLGVGDSGQVAGHPPTQPVPRGNVP